MPLPSGIRLGPCEIVSAIGAGGMGEVYRARDTRLKRHVAINVLPEAFANDPDRDRYPSKKRSRSQNRSSMRSKPRMTRASSIAT
jgi:serine/threonine protein kinase